jgi:hypothetical protein
LPAALAGALGGWRVEANPTASRGLGRTIGWPSPSSSSCSSCLARAGGGGALLPGGGAIGCARPALPRGSGPPVPCPRPRPFGLPGPPMVPPLARLGRGLAGDDRANSRPKPSPSAAVSSPASRRFARFLPLLFPLPFREWGDGLLASRGWPSAWVLAVQSRTIWFARPHLKHTGLGVAPCLPLFPLVPLPLPLPFPLGPFPPLGPPPLAREASKAARLSTSIGVAPPPPDPDAISCACCASRYFTVSARTSS